MMWIASHVKGAMGELKHVGYPDPVTGKETRVMAREVNIPGQNITGWYDASGTPLPVPASKVRQVSLTEARPAQPSYLYSGPTPAPQDMKIGDQAIKKGEPVMWRQSNEQGSKIEYTAKATFMPRAPSTAAPRGDSAAVMQAKHKLGVENAIYKVMQQGLEGKAFQNASGKPMEGTELARKIGEQAQKFYSKDPEVAPFLPSIFTYVNTEARKGALKGDVLKHIMGLSGQTQQGLGQAQTQQQIDDLKQDMEEMFKGLSPDAQTIFGGQSTPAPTPSPGGTVDIPDQ